MKISLDRQGLIKEVLTSRNFKGSYGINDINLDIDNANVQVSNIEIIYQLPNGITYRNDMDKISNSKWRFSINSPMTDIAGIVKISFIIYYSQDSLDKRLTSPIINMKIEDSILIDDL